jgi:hypothetical protein
MNKTKNDLEAVYSAMKIVGMNTLEIMLGLMRALYQVSREVKNTDRSLRDITILNAKTADSVATLQSNEEDKNSPAALRQALSFAEKAVDDLASWKTTAWHADEHQATVDQLKADVEKINAQHEKLLTQVNQIKDEQENEIADLYKQREAGTITDAEIQEKIKKMREKQEMITSEIYTKLLPKEELTQRKIEDQYLSSTKIYADEKNIPAPSELPTPKQTS